MNSKKSSELFRETSMSATDSTRPPLQVPSVNARRESAATILDQLRQRLSPQGDVVSPRGRALTEKVFGQPLSPVEVVQRICGDVAREGTAALLRYGAALDGADLKAEQLRVPAADLQAAHQQADPQLMATVRRIRDQVSVFQRAILHADVSLSPRPGVQLQQRYVPLRRIGVCVPGGAAAYPSTVLMTVVPAQVAGVQEIVVVAPPTPFGSYNNDMLATCHELGVREVYRMGGAQAVAALAYGCDAVPAVDKIVGPGNLFVALAKKHVYGTVDIDSIAGPSEVIVIADESARADFIAADLLAQAEHSPGSAILITWHEPLLEAVRQELQRQLSTLQRAELTIESLESFSALILVRDAEHACALTDQFAPEHLHIATANPRELVGRIRNCGAAFLGHFTPVALGDYAAGPSHVLPTGGTARWAAGLSSNDFLRSSSVIEFDQPALDAIAPDVQRLAEKEGLTAHAASVSIRRTSALPPQRDRMPSTEHTNPFRAAIDQMQPYVPGEQPQGGKFIKLNTNENPYPAPPAVHDAIQAALAGGLQRYPDPTASSFRRQAAEVLGLPGDDWILAGNGSDEILTMLVRAMVGEGQCLRLPYPSYILYRTLADIQGARWQQVSFEDGWKLPAAFGQAEDDLRLAFLPNPNSPSGTVLTPEEVLALAERLPCPLVVDEAYADFADTNCLSLVQQSEKILVTRTLSKSYALAGLRFGFVVAQPHLIAGLQKIKDSYNCDTLSIVGATAALASTDWLAENVRTIKATRQRMQQRLTELGFEVTPSQANFVWCQHPHKSHKELYEQLKRNQILVRYMNFPQWGDGLRISVGTDDQADACLLLLSQL